MLLGSSRQCNAGGKILLLIEGKDGMLRSGHLYRYHGTFGFSRGVESLEEVMEKVKARIIRGAESET